MPFARTTFELGSLCRSPVQRPPAGLRSFRRAFAINLISRSLNLLIRLANIVQIKFGGEFFSPRVYGAGCSGFSTLELNPPTLTKRRGETQTYGVGRALNNRAEQ